MSSITFLNSHNFVVAGTRQKTLGINIQGNIFVFFKMDGCKNCAQFEPIFAQLAKQEDRVTCALLNITQNREVVMWARETSTPITSVPILILYVDGRPHAKFNGTKNIPSIRKFITNALSADSSRASQQQFMPQHQQPAAHNMSPNMYGGARPPQGGQAGSFAPGKSYMPEIGSAPSMKGIIKGYAAGNNVEDDEDARLVIPDTVIPHNTPWEAEINEVQ